MGTVGMEMRVGERLEVEFDRQRYTSSVAGLCEDGTIQITVPMLRRSGLFLQPDEVVRVLYFRPTGVFSFTARLRERMNDGTVELFKMELCSPISKHQRRNYVRFETVLPVSVRILSREGELVPIERSDPPQYTARYPDRGEPETVRVPCYTLDLSGGGMRIVTFIHIPERSVLECTLTLSEEMVVKGFVSGSEEEVLDGLRRYVVRMRFVDIDSRRRQRIIRYIYQEQIRRRRRERSAARE